MVTAVSEMLVETALDNIAVGEVCDIVPVRGGDTVAAQVVSAQRGRSVLAPLAQVTGLTVGARVCPRGEGFSVRCGDALIGRTIDGLGQPMDGRPLNDPNLKSRAVLPRGANPLDRHPISDVLPTRIRTIDGLLSIGNGQRLAILGEAGAGKSTLLGMLASGTAADVVVIGMIGERGREVREFIERQLPPAVRARCVVVAATSDRPALERINAGHVAATVAEYFREQGKNVLLLFDSVTRFARALREVGLAAGEEAVRGGLTPSVYANLPRLIERSGRLGAGAVTAFYSVLMENNGVNDPLTEEVVSLTDGHVVLDSRLAQKGRYPAIDVLKSKSRLMNELVGRDHRAAAGRIRGLMAKYNDIELLIQVGEYVPGQDAEADAAIAARPAIEKFLTQALGEANSFNETAFHLSEIARGADSNA